MIVSDNDIPRPLFKIKFNLAGLSSKSDVNFGLAFVIGYSEFFVNIDLSKF